MIIRSQNKELITTDLNLLVDKWGIEYVIKNNSFYLAWYSTREKGIKVLDMICDTCRNIAFIDEQAIIFQMPQDSEV